MNVSEHLLRLQMVCFLFFFVSCSSSKKSETNIHSAIKEKSAFSLRAVTVPESRSVLVVPSAELQELPPSAVYTQKNGQAAATVRFFHDTLFVTASCDSLQALVYRYENEMEESGSHAETETKETETRAGSGWLVISAILGFVSGVIVRPERRFSGNRPEIHLK